MDTQTCTMCGAIGGSLSFAPTSGWDWYGDVRLCPAHSIVHKVLIFEAITAEKDRAERTRKAVLAVACPYCHAQAGERCQSPRGTKQAVFHTVREKEARPE